MASVAPMILVAPPIADWRSFRLTQGFGANPAFYAPYGLDGHEGLDWSMAQGTPITASHTGHVSIPAWSDTYGLYLWLTGERVATLYAHLSQYETVHGRWVQAGETIALSGNTGRSTGAHLHWGVCHVPREWGNGYKGMIDPLPLLLAWEESMTDALLRAKTARFRLEQSIRMDEQAAALRQQATDLESSAKALRYSLVSLEAGEMYAIEAALGGDVPAQWKGVAHAE